MEESYHKINENASESCNTRKYENIPTSLKNLPQWVSYLIESRNGKQAKKPINPHNGHPACVNDPSTWSSFDEAVAAIDRFNLRGIGFVFTANDPFCGVDLDICFDPETGEIKPQAQAIIDRLHSYTEFSQSRTGLHIIIKGELPPGRRRKGQLEVYDQGRFFVMTGDYLPGTPTAIECRQSVIESLHAELFLPAEQHCSSTPPQVVGSDDQALLEKMFSASNGDAIRRLWQGDISGYGSQSEADLALCSHLSFWTDSDAARIDHLFRRSALMRDKWKRNDYRESTIKKALSKTDKMQNSAHTFNSHNSHNSHGNSEENWGGTPPLPWPELDQKALYGLPGDIVKTIDPHTEADQVAILMQFLTAFGALVGRNTYFVVEATRHYMNTFSVFVGETSKARKGTSEAHVRRLIDSVKEDFVANCIVSGLSSGEGLIWQVRDEIVKTEPIKQKGIVVDYQKVISDPGIDDKRLLVIEPEFARVLRVINRDGNTLSTTIRQAWDTGDLRTLTKNSPARATNAHIGIIGHITAEELQRHLTGTEAANGFGNRFLWFCVRRSKFLPEGGNYTPQPDLVEQLRKTVSFAEKAHEMVRSPAARNLWHDRYEELSAGKPGLVGAIGGRAEAQVLRLSCLYALLDRSAVVEQPHLEAALALWDYAEASACYLFGDKLGDPLADEILRMLRQSPQGMTRTDISNSLGRHRKANEIGNALTRLYEQHLVRFDSQPTSGRPVQTWYAVKSKTVSKGEKSERSEKSPAGLDTHNSHNSHISLTNATDAIADITADLEGTTVFQTEDLQQQDEEANEEHQATCSESDDESTHSGDDDVRHTVGNQEIPASPNQVPEEFSGQDQHDNPGTVVNADEIDTDDYFSQDDGQQSAKKLVQEFVRTSCTQIPDAPSEPEPGILAAVNRWLLAQNEPTLPDGSVVAALRALGFTCQQGAGHMLWSGLQPRLDV